jgi:small-conductance mechanosensitive channel
MINKTLTEKSILIAFPQRYIHLDTSRPLEVRVLANAPDTGNEKCNGQANCAVSDMHMPGYAQFCGF